MSATFTFSVDDGSPADLQMAQILTKLGIRATFYIPYRKLLMQALPMTTFEYIQQHHEVQSHCVYHLDLTTMRDIHAEEQLDDSRKLFATVLKKPPALIGYPFGKYTDEIIQVARKVGYVGGRGVDWAAGPKVIIDPFKLHVHAEAGDGDALQCGLNPCTVPDVISRARAVYDAGEVFSMFAHSWKITQWDKLESLLRELKSIGSWKFETNEEVLRSRGLLV